MQLRRRNSRVWLLLMPVVLTLFLLLMLSAHPKADSETPCEPTDQRAETQEGEAVSYAMTYQELRGCVE